jgi:hypothetical protein
MDQPWIKALQQVDLREVMKSTTTDPANKMTPKRWESIPQTNGNRIIARVFDDSPGLRLVCQVMVRKETMQEDLANAKGIEALPDLVEALEFYTTGKQDNGALAKAVLQKAGLL